jgi:hypothetical protein
MNSCFSKILVSVYLCLAVASATAGQIEIGGIQLGASLDDAKRGIAALNPSYQIQALSEIYPPSIVHPPTALDMQLKPPIGDGKLRGYIATTPCTDTTVSPWDCIPDDQFIAVQGYGTSIWYIARTQQYRNPAKRFTEKALLTSLNEKYGKWSGERGSTGAYGERQIAWSFDVAGKQAFGITDVVGVMDGRDKRGPCWELGFGSLLKINLPGDVNTTCGRYVNVGYKMDENQMVVALYLEASDNAHMANIVTGKLKSAETEKAKAAEAQRAKGLKPNL